MSSELKVDTISEKTSAGGVTIDGVKLKDNAVETNTISEGTSGSGVTIDNLLIKDGVAHSGLVKLATVTASSTSEIDFNTGVTGWDNSTYRSFVVRGKWIIPTVDTARLLVKIASGTDKRTGTYEIGMYQRRIDASGSGYYQQDYTDAIEFAAQLGTGTRETAAFSLEIFPSGDSGSNHTGLTLGTFDFLTKASNGATWNYKGGIGFDSTSYVDGAYVSMSTGNIASGIFDFYGVK